MELQPHILFYLFILNLRQDLANYVAQARAELMILLPHPQSAGILGVCPTPSFYHFSTALLLV